MSEIEPTQGLEHVRQDIRIQITVFDNVDPHWLRFNVANAIRDYLRGLGIGEELYPTDLTNIVGHFLGVKKAEVVFPKEIVSVTNTQKLSAGTIKVRVGKEE